MLRVHRIMEVRRLTDYIDPEQYGNDSNDKLDYKFILMRQIDKVRLSRSTEMRGGYWEDKPISMGGGITTIRVYIPDARETYVNSVKSLRSLLIVYWDSDFTKEYTALKDVFEKEVKEKEVDWYNREVITLYDLIFEELLKLCLRSKLIGGSRLVSDDVSNELSKKNNEK